MQDQKDDAKRMNRWLTFMSFLVVIVSFGVVCFLQTVNARQDVSLTVHGLAACSYTGLLVFSNGVIIYSIREMRKTISSVKSVEVNSRSMKLHLIVFSVYSLFEVLAALIFWGYSWHCKGEIEEEGEHHIEEHDIVIEDVFLGCSAIVSLLIFLTVLFLLQLIITYAKYDSDKAVQDDLLDREVPIFVHIQNQKLI